MEAGFLAPKCCCNHICKEALLIWNQPPRQASGQICHDLCLKSEAKLDSTPAISSGFMMRPLHTSLRLCWRSRKPTGLGVTGKPLKSMNFFLIFNINSSWCFDEKRETKRAHWNFTRISLAKCWDKLTESNPRISIFKDLVWDGVQVVFFLVPTRCSLMEIHH